MRTVSHTIHQHAAAKLRGIELIKLKKAGVLPTLLHELLSLVCFLAGVGTRKKV